MPGKFLTPGEIADLKRSQDKVNSLQQRENTTGFHTELTVCGCPDPNCGGWHTVILSRPLPSSEAASAILKAHNQQKIPKSKRLKSPLIYMKEYEMNNEPNKAVEPQ